MELRSERLNYANTLAAMIHNSFDPWAYFCSAYNIGHIVERLKADSIDGSKTTANGFDVPRKWNYEGLDYLLQNEKYPRDAANASLLNPTDRGGERAYS